MNRKKLAVFLGVEAVACLLLLPSGETLLGGVLGLASFPFAQIGLLLRQLSLSGWVGNALAIGALVLLSLLPVGTRLWMGKKYPLRWEDSLLVILTLVLPAVLYWMINPTWIPVYGGVSYGKEMGMAVLGGVVYSILLAYLVLILMRRCARGGAEALPRMLSGLLAILCGVLTLLIFGICLRRTLSSVEALKAANTIPGAPVQPTIVVLWVGYLVEIVPYALDIWGIFAGIDLVDGLAADPYSDSTLRAAETLSHRCRWMLIATVLSNLGYNLLQLLMMPRLLSMHVNLSFPLSSVLMALAALLIAGRIRSAKVLKDDNDLFI